jgi:MFS family permease
MEHVGTASKEAKANASLQQCIVVHMIGQLLTPLQTQSYVALLPLLISDQWEQPIALVGVAFFVMTLTCMVSFAVMPMLLSRYTTRNLLLGASATRIVAGVLYESAVLMPAEPLGLPLLLLSRGIYGATLFSFAIPVPWIALKVEDPTEKGVQIAKVQGGA